MVPLLSLIFLFNGELSGKRIDLQPQLNAYIGQKLNNFRQSVASGTALKRGGHLPSSSSMFSMDLNSKYQRLAILNSRNCIKGDDFPPGEDLSMNFYSISSLHSPVKSDAVLDFALSQWELEPYVYGIGDDVKYNNAELQGFANIVHFKTTEYGCHYQVCKIPQMPTINVLTCVFNNPPTINEPLYVASTVGEKGGCSSDNDCQQYVPFSKCHTSASTSNHYKGLCYTTNVTTFTKSTTVATPTPTTVMSTTAPATTAGTTATESTTAVTEPMTVPTVCSIDPITDAIRTKIVTMHNYRRSRLAQGLVPNGSTGKNAPQGKNIYELTYSKELELEAQNYANTCPSNGSSLASRNSGENFEVVPSSSVMTYYGAVFRAVKSFWNEIKMHEVNEDLLFSMHAMNETTAPLKFTQMAWASTTHVGCGAKLCGDNFIVVCRYSPRGNIVNQNIYNAGPMCSQCFGTCSKTYLYKGLCVSPFDIQRN